MNTLVLMQQMLILLAMMAAGFIAYKVGWIDNSVSGRISTLVVRIFNPFLILTAISGEIADEVRAMMPQNLVISVVYFVFLAAAGILYAAIRRFPKKENRRQQLMILLPNVGFMGIPVVRGLFGDEYVIFVVFYMVFYNVIAYTYGIMLAFGMSDTKETFSIKKMFNTGFIFGVAAALMFAFNISLPGPLSTLCSYLGNCAIPLSMLLVGASVAQMDFKALVKDKENYIFFVVRMLVIPAIGILLLKLIPLHDEVKIICCIMLAMPVGSLTGMLAEDYGHCGASVNRIVAITTILSVITIPVLSVLF